MINKYGLDDFMREIEADKFGKKDFRINNDCLKMDDDGSLVGESDDQSFVLKLNEWGRNQVLWRTGATGFNKYGSYLHEIGREKELADLFNMHMERLVERRGIKKWLVRAKGGTARAVLTDRYSMLDNDFLADNIYKYFKDIDVSVVGNNISDVYMNIRIKINDMTISANNDSDPLSVALHVVNSEVGASSIVVYPVVYRQVCSNGMVVEYGTGQKFRQRHLVSADEGQEKINAKVADAIKAGDVAISEFLKTKDVKISNPKEVIERLAKDQKYNDKLLESIQESFKVENDYTKYGVINAFTRSARDFDYEKRIEIERFAGSLLMKKIA